MVDVSSVSVAGGAALLRRGVLARLGGGFGGLVVSSLLAEQTAVSAGEATGYDLRPKPPHFAPKAKAVIQLFMHGGPSHVDLFDPKPMLEKYDGKQPPQEAEDDEKKT